MMSNEIAKLMFHNDPQLYFCILIPNSKEMQKKKSAQIIRLESKHSKHWWIGRGYLDVLTTIKIFFPRFLII